MNEATQAHLAATAKSTVLNPDVEPYTHQLAAVHAMLQARESISET